MTNLPLDGVLAFMQALWAVAHGLQARSKRMQAELGVTGPQRLVIRVLAKFPRITVGEVARVLHVHPSTMTGVVWRLEQNRLVARHADVEDRRRARLDLTKAGQRVNRMREGTVEEAIDRALGRCSARDVEAAQRVLKAVAAELVAEDAG